MVVIDSDEEPLPNPTKERLNQVVSVESTAIDGDIHTLSIVTKAPRALVHRFPR